MRTFKVITLVSLAIILSGAVSAQKIKLVSGDLGFLKGQTILKISYDYGTGDMDVGKYDNEADYIKDKIAEKNEDEPGSGDIWYEAWINDRHQRFQPRFEEFLNAELEKSGVFFWSENEEAQYTMILKTTSTEPGFNVGVAKRPAWINVEVVFVETANPDKELAIISVEKAVQKKSAGGFDFEVAYRIEYAYANCAKKLGKYFVKEEVF